MMGIRKLADMQSIIGSRPSYPASMTHPLGAMIVIIQRLHEDDLVGNLMKLGHWDVLSLPAIAPDDIEVPCLITSDTHRKMVSCYTGSSSGIDPRKL